MQIVNFPHPTLRHKSKAVKRVDAELKQIVRKMFELMYAANGVGLAANQVDLPLRLFIVNMDADPEKGEELVFINPVISKPKGLAEAEEGCLSLPEMYGQVKRPERIRFNAYTLGGQQFEAELDGLFGRVIQHENDHLDGVLFVDRMSETGRMKVQTELEEFETEFEFQRQKGAFPDDDQIAARLTKMEKKYC